MAILIFSAATFGAAMLGAEMLGAAAQDAEHQDLEPSPAERAQQSREISKNYAKQLKSALMRAIKAGGPETAIAICHTAAPAIAKKKSAASGWSFGRTALKLRNQQNAPDPWEHSVLLKFQDEVSQGADMATLEYYEETTKDGEPAFRYMKAIPTKGLCLTCHGSNVSQSVKDKIDELYPEDQATGFSLGDLRGAFTVVQPLP